jgi:hypothetical protein
MTPLERHIEAIATQLTVPSVIAQVAVIVASVGLGWLVGGALRKHVRDKGVWASTAWPTPWSPWASSP